MIEILRDHGRSAPALVADAALGRPPFSSTPSPSIVASIEPWAEPVEGAQLLDHLAAGFARYAVLPDGGADALALWSLHTYLYDVSPITPRLAVFSPTMRCGKTLVLRILTEICCKPLPAANLAAAVTFRVIEMEHPTLLIDEADTFLKSSDELRGILNAGYDRGGSVLRTVGKNHEPRAFDVFAPVAIAAIGRISGTLLDRSIVISMRRKSRNERVDRFRSDRVTELRDLARQTARWAADHRDHLHLDPAIPHALHDREADNWRLLFSIADRAGGEWPDRARAAALVLSARDDEDESSVTLLGDIHAIFGARGVARMATPDLLTDLYSVEDRPWGDWLHGRPMTPQALGRQLHPFGIRSAKWREGADTIRGYERRDFVDAWERYL